MKPHLWIAYDYSSISDCLSMLDTILKQYPNRDIIHEISSSTLRQAALDGVAIVSEFRARLNNDQLLVADFKGHDVCLGAAERFCYPSLTNLLTMMATAPDNAIQDAIEKANTTQDLVVFDLMNCLDDDWNAERAQKLADLGARFVSCHAQPSNSSTGNSPTSLINKVCQQLQHSSTQVIARECTSSNIKDLKPYVDQNQIFAVALHLRSAPLIASGSTIDHSQDPIALVEQFLAEINSLVPGATIKEPNTPQPHTDAQWAMIDELVRGL